MKKIAIIIGLFVLLSGCVTHKPIPDDYDGPLARVSDTAFRLDSSQGYFFELTNVDGRDITTSLESSSQASYGKGFSLSIVTESRQVPAKQSQLQLKATNYYAAPILMLKGGNYSVEGDVNVNLEANKTYYIKGELSKTYSAVWVEDAQGNIVSEKIEKKDS